MVYATLPGTKEANGDLTIQPMKHPIFKKKPKQMTNKKRVYYASSQKKKKEKAAT